MCTVPRVLFLAFYFPPVGGSGVQRTVKFLRHLKDFGYEATVLAPPLGSTGHSMTGDPTLEADLPDRLVLRRIAGPEPPRSGRWRGRAERWLGLPPPLARWWVSGLVDTATASADRVDLVFATMSPFESAEAAGAIAARLGVPWVADLRDPWALDEMFAYPSRLHRRMGLARMARSLSTASAVVLNTPEATARVVAAFPGFGNRVVTITNGYDAEDLLVPPAPREDSGTFRIVHAGDLHTALGLEHRRTMLVRRLLGGSLGRVDVLTRSHVFLLAALDELRSRRPDLDGRFELHLVGDLTPQDLAAIRQPYVKTHGYRPHLETVALMRSANLLFLPMHDLDPGRRASIVPGKTYEYLAAGPPILAAVPDGDARDFLEAAGHALLCRPNDVGAMSRAVEERLDGFLCGEPAPSADMSTIQMFERRRLAETLAATFDKVLAHRRVMFSASGPVDGGYLVDHSRASAT